MHRLLLTELMAQSAGQTGFKAPNESKNRPRTAVSRKLPGNFFMSFDNAWL